jgi:hypothetical protein
MSQLKITSLNFRSSYKISEQVTSKYDAISIVIFKHGTFQQTFPLQKKVVPIARSNEILNSVKFEFPAV